MNRAHLLFASILLACAPATPLPALPEAEPRQEPLVDRVGLAMGLWPGTDAEATAHRDGQLARIEALGVKWIRTDFCWHLTERTKDMFDFAPLDAMVDAAERRGMRFIGVLDYGNPVYGGGSSQGTQLSLDYPPEVFVPPAEPAPFARFASQVAARFRGRIDRYEIWNEENIGYRFWRPKADALAYGQLAIAAATAGRQACPECRFSLGGLSMPQPIPRIDLYPVGPTYLRELYRLLPELNASLDAVAFHPYQYPKDMPEFETALFPDRRQGSLTTQTRQIRSLVDANGPKELWITENGWPTNPNVPETDADVARVFGIPESVVTTARELFGDDFNKVIETVRGVSERDQARYFVRSVLLSLVNDVRLVMLYTLDDFPREPELNQESAFGMYRVDGSDKDAAVAMRVMLTRYGSFAYAGDVSAALGLEEGERAVALRTGTRAVIGMWRYSGGTRKLAIGKLPGATKVIDWSGKELRTAPRGGAIEVELTPDVTWVELE